MAMQTVDAVIAVIGAVALIATVTGVLLYDDLAGEQDVVFLSSDMTGTPQTGDNGQTLIFAVPNNATGASLAIDIAFMGQSGLGGDSNVVVSFTGPNGTDGTYRTSITIGPNSGGEVFSVPVDMFSWASAPEKVLANPDTVDETQAWTTPLSVTVTVDQPNDSLLAIPGGAVNYNFVSTVTPTFSVYAASVMTPELENI